jgi:hypothetical protein
MSCSASSTSSVFAIISIILWYMANIWGYTLPHHFLEYIKGFHMLTTLCIKPPFGRHSPELPEIDWQDKDYRQKSHGGSC